MVTIKRFATTAGFLENCEVELSDGLNCIIGARGTCKSTVVESIRFAFTERDAGRVAELVGRAPDPAAKALPHFGLIRTTLAAGTVRCEVISGDALFVVEREVDEAPRVYADGVREHADTSLLNQIEIYSQGDLQRIAESDALRVALIDRPHADRIKHLLSERKRFAQELATIGPELRTARSQAQALRQQLQPLSQFREELARLEQNAPKISPELASERAAFERRERVLELLSDMVRIRESVIAATQALPALHEQARTVLSNVSREAAREAIPERLEELASLVDDIGRAAKTIEAVRDSDLASLLSDIQARLNTANDTYFKLRQQEQSVNETLKRQHQLRRQVEHMERVAREIAEVQAREAEFIRRRDELRASAAGVDSEMYTLRVGQVDAINEEHGEAVHLRLAQGTASAGYADALFRLLGGSRIRAQEEVAADLAATFPPAALIAVVESGSGQRFAEVLGRDLGQMNRVVAHLSDHAELHKLEVDPPATRLEITMFDHGEPKPMETLSKGQKATALLPLILRPLPHPLIVDQPEDDLDNSFIFRSLVKAIRTLKKKRQLIFVTHNANIPVLGDADRVIVMTMQTPTKANPPASGSVDDRKEDILHLLEGGAEAFRERESRYHDILSKV